MLDAELQAMMRRAELERRDFRRKGLLRLIQNEGKLLYEDLTADDIAAHMAAVKAIAKQEDILREELERQRYGYWTRLWRAITNKGAR